MPARASCMLPGRKCIKVLSIYDLYFMVCGAKQKKLRWGLGYINNRSWARSHQSSRANLHIYRIIPGNAHDAHHCQNTLTFLSLGSFLLQTSRWNWQSSLSPSLVRHWLPPKMRPNQHQRGRTSPNKHQRGRMTVSKLSRVGNRLMIVYHCDLRCFSMNVEQNNCVQCCMNLIFTAMTPSPLSHRFISYVWHKCNQAILRKLMVPTRQRRGRLEWIWNNAGLFRQLLNYYSFPP